MTWRGSKWPTENLCSDLFIVKSDGNFWWMLWLHSYSPKSIYACRQSLFRIDDPVIHVSINFIYINMIKVSHVPHERKTKLAGWKTVILTVMKSHSWTNSVLSTQRTKKNQTKGFLLFASFQFCNNGFVLNRVLMYVKTFGRLWRCLLPGIWNVRIAWEVFRVRV